MRDARVLLRCVCVCVPPSFFLPGNSRVYVRINYWFNGSMTKNVKEGLERGACVRSARLT